jgi:hypothetical protein
MTRPKDEGTFQNEDEFSGGVHFHEEIKKKQAAHIGERVREIIE